MNAYRFAVRSYAVHDVCYLHTDVAVSVPPGELEAVLLSHRLQPVAGRIAAVGIFETEKETREAHEDLVKTLHIIDVTGLRISQDQSQAYRDRRTGALFTRPLVLEDDKENVFILDSRQRTKDFDELRPVSWLGSDPLKKAGHNVTYLGELFDGSDIRLSSMTADVVPYADQADDWLCWRPSAAELDQLKGGVK